MFRKRFKKFGGDKIVDIIDYIKEYIKEDPNITISVGCDSIQRRKRTVYACTVMLYNSTIKNGAHVVFFRENLEKVRDNNVRLQKEATFAYEIAEFLDKELRDINYTRKDITDLERKRYKFHIELCNGNLSHVKPHDQESFINNMSLTDFEKNVEYKLVDIHVDFNPFDSTAHSRGRTNNKSSVSYHAFTPWLRGMNYRTYAKPLASAATSAADLLLQD